jgi:hypothetical protein
VSTNYAQPAPDGAGRPSREDGIRRASRATTGLVAASAVAVVGFGVLAHDHRAGSSGSSSSGSTTGGDLSSQNGSSDGSQNSPFGGGSGLILGGSGGGGGFHANSGGS